MIATLPPTRLTLQEDGSFRGTGPLNMKIDDYQSGGQLRGVGEGMNQLVIEARKERGDTLFHDLTLTLISAPIMMTITHPLVRTLHHPLQYKMSPMGSYFRIELGKPLEYYHREMRDLIITLIEAPEKP
jgi:hypothetical protein